MTDMDALFARRKKGKKKSSKNMNVVLDQVDLLDDEKRVIQEFDADGNEISMREVPVLSKRIGNLTAAVNASKKKASEAEDNVISVNKHAASDLVTGEWVDTDEKRQQPSLLGSSSLKVVDMENLASSKPDPTKSRDVLDKEEENRKLFHWKRKQAIEEAKAKVNKPEKEEVKKPAFFRPRELAEANRNREGAAALKELDNEKVFPSLGGGAAAARKSSAPASVWGVVQEEILEDFAVKQADGEYLGFDFEEAEEFGGFKKGYCFKKGLKGLGYYWEGPRQETAETDGEDTADQEATGDETDVAEAAEAAAATEAAQEAEAASKPREPTEEELQAQREAEEERERKRQLKKAEKERKRQERERLEREERERQEKEAADAAAAAAAAASAPAATATPAGEEPPPPEARFAGLKKKKKKKAAQ